MKSRLFLAVILMGALSACGITKTYVFRNPTASARLVQKWTLVEFVHEMEENQRKKQLDFFDSQRSLVPPSFFLNFAPPDLVDLRSHAVEGDFVYWYSGKWLDMDINYIRVERDGKQIWSHKIVERRPETEANKSPQTTRTFGPRV